MSNCVICVTLSRAQSCDHASRRAGVCALSHSVCVCVCVTCRVCESVCSPVCVYMCELKCVWVAAFDTRVIMGDTFVCTDASQSAFVFVLPVFSQCVSQTHCDSFTHTHKYTKFTLT